MYCVNTAEKLLGERLFCARGRLTYADAVAHLFARALASQPRARFFRWRLRTQPTPDGGT